MSRISEALASLLFEASGLRSETILESPSQKATATGPLIAYQNLSEPVWAPRDYSAFAREGFMQNAIVYRSVRMIAEAAATIPLLLYEGANEIEDHPLIDLLRRPSLDHTGTDFLEAWYGFLLVAGNAYVEAVALDGEIRELHILRPDRMKVIPGLDGWPEGYEYTVAGRSVRFVDEVAANVRPILHVRLFHPANDHYGMSPIEAAATAIDIHNTASSWNKALLDNSARPSGALVYAAANGQMTEEQFTRLKSELERSFQGARAAGRPLLLEGGLDWKPLSLTPKDMDFIEAKNTAAREIALAIGVPPMLLGIPGDNTYSNDPYDPGGPTNRGVTLEVYANFKGQTLDAGSRPRLISELKSIPEAVVEAIYRRRYFDPAQCAAFTAPLALMHFDAAVNHGVGAATRMLQQVVNVTIDGEIGPETLSAIGSRRLTDLIDEYAEIRRARYRALPHFWRFGRGWLKRVDATLALGKSWGAADGMTRGLLEPAQIAKGESNMSNQAPSAKTIDESAKWWAQSRTLWGTLITAAATVLPVIAPAIGVSLPADLIQTFGNQAVIAVQALAGLFGTALAIYGRFKASSVLSLRKS
ncbi:phage portal protein [Hyphomicrobium sp. ghe19]|uniref:phage portal protein n=1 Tax=Hyphomicrobium sp. ghe19 TaxID=2682968 RepID=UPI0013673441|nr:hypothetical protein HYPP_02018 [Hyphomicrobium sp. ghe19]